MPLRQIARTPKVTFPPRYGDEAYAFATEVRRVTIDGRSRDVVVVRCPWCGCEHLGAARPLLAQCPDDSSSGRAYVVAIPAGTPVLA